MNLLASSILSIVFIAVIVLCLSLQSGCSETGSAAVEPENLTTVSFSVKGMSCQGCVASVRNAIAKVDGVYGCDVSLTDEAATVRLTDADAVDGIVAAVAALDFTIEQVQ